MRQTTVIMELVTLTLLSLLSPSNILASSEMKVADLSARCKSGKQSACRDLTKISTSEPDAKVRSFAVSQLTDQSLLAKIAVEDKDAGVRRSAVYHLVDQSLLAGIAAKDEDAGVRAAAGLMLGRMLVGLAEKGNVTAVGSLLDIGVSANSRDEAGYTALMYASARGHLELVRILLAKGADVNATEVDRGYFEFTGGGQGVLHQGDTNTALSLATSNGHSEIRELLIKAGAK